MEFIPLHSGSSGNLYQLTADSGQLLIEAGISIARIRKSLGYRLSNISAALISHRHKDHSRSAKELARAGIDLYMTAPTAQALGIDSHRLHIITAREQFSIAGFDVLPFATEHDCEGAVGFLIANGADKLLFATDTFFIRYRFKNLTHIAVECNFSPETIDPDINPVRRKRLYHSHFSLPNVKKFLLANDLSRVRAIYLLHLSNDNADPDYFQAEIKALTGKPVYVSRMP